MFQGKIELNAEVPGRFNGKITRLQDPDRDPRFGSKPIRVHSRGSQS